MPRKSTISTTRTLTTCAFLTALTVVLARLVVPMPNEITRFSIEAVPVFLAGMLFGPVAGGLVGFASDFIGCVFLSAYPYNPVFCLPPVLYGLCAGFFRPMLLKKASIFRIALAFLPAIALGSILYQSLALALIYGGDAFWPFFVEKLSFRSIQFAITYVLDVAIVFFLQKSNVFSAAKLTDTQRRK